MRSRVRFRPDEVAPVISVAMLGGGADAAAYYLERSADCDVAEYYTGEREAAGRWCGRGAAALRLTGAVKGERAAEFAGLLDGRLPDGSLVARPVWRADSRGLLGVGPLVCELTRMAETRGVELSAVFDDPDLGATAAKLVARHEASVTRPRWQVRVDARVVANLATAAGLNPHVLYPRGRRALGFAAAFAHAGERVDVRRSGLDVVVSAPKSVSVLYGLGDERVSAVLTAAHEHAVDEALTYLQRHTSHALRGHHGDGQRARQIGTDGFIAAAFTHRTSRADDPQLHTHVVIANLLHGEDGKWSAVDSRAVHRHARTAGCLYQAVLRGELTRHLGVEWGPLRKGVAEIASIPRELLRTFSRRREAIECELDRTGSRGRRATQRAAYRTRPAKTHAPEVSLREQWAARVRDLGHDPGRLVADALHRVAAPPGWPAPEQVAAELFGPDGLTAHATSFDQRDVLQALTQALPTGVPVSGQLLESAAHRMLSEPDAVPLLRPATGDDGPRWTAAGLLAVEQIALMLATTTTQIPPHTRTHAAAVVGATTLTEEQRTIAAGLLTSPRTVDVVVGPAGSGKTGLLRTAAEAWVAAGVPVLGCALAAVTAQRLEAATAIPSSSLARLLADADRSDRRTGQPSGLPRGSVVVVDEASMVGTRALASLSEHVAAADGKLVLVGDPAQLPEIDAGGLFAAFTRHATPLSDNQRQTHGWERAALLAMRDGDIEVALAAYLAHDRISIADSPANAREQLIASYVERRLTGSDPYDTIAIACSCADVAKLNRGIRAALRDVVGDRPLRVVCAGEVREYAAGDVAVVTRNDHQRGLLNGTRTTVTASSDHELCLTTDAGVHARLPAGWVAEHLDHGYALTVHKAQGLTAETALVYGTAALTQQAGYVALSRGRVDNQLFTSSDDLTTDRTVEVDVPARFQLLRGRDIDAAHELEQRLRNQPRHTLASEQQPQPRPSGLHGAGARARQDDFHRQSRSRDDDFGLSR